MGRIHRYGQEKDCLIFNFVSTNTSEGRVLSKLFERISQIEDDLDPKRTGKVFNVLGEIFPANQLERMLRDMYAHNNMTEELIKQRITKEVDSERFRNITNSTLEGLAKRELNLSAIVGKSAEAKERRLVPEVIQDFFLQSAPISGVQIKQPNKQKPVYRVGKVPRNLWPIGERLEPRFGRLGREYAQVIFDKKILQSEPTAEWVTPGHPLFEAVRDDVQELVRRDMEISLNELIHRQNMRMAELMTRQQTGDSSPLLAANLKTTEDRIDDLNGRLDRRRAELQQERHCTIADIQVLGRAWRL